MACPAQHRASGSGHRSHGRVAKKRGKEMNVTLYIAKLQPLRARVSDGATPGHAGTRARLDVAPLEVIPLACSRDTTYCTSVRSHPRSRRWSTPTVEPQRACQHSCSHNPRQHPPRGRALTHTEDAAPRLHCHQSTAVMPAAPHPSTTVPSPARSRRTAATRFRRQRRLTIRGRGLRWPCGQCA